MMCVLRSLFRPLSSVLVRSSFVINKVAQHNRVSRNLSVDELSQALELTDINDTPEESNMLEGIIRLAKKRQRK